MHRERTTRGRRHGTVAEDDANGAPIPKPLSTKSKSKFFRSTSKKKIFKETQVVHIDDPLTPMTPSPISMTTSSPADQSPHDRSNSLRKGGMSPLEMREAGFQRQRSNSQVCYHIFGLITYVFGSTLQEMLEMIVKC